MDEQIKSRKHTYVGFLEEEYVDNFQNCCFALLSSSTGAKQLPYSYVRDYYINRNPEASTDCHELRKQLKAKAVPLYATEVLGGEEV
jgi:trehalose-6-phosphate synthase